MGKLGQKQHRITKHERAEVVRLRKAFVAVRDIAAHVGISPSTTRWILAREGVKVPDHVRGINNRENYLRQNAAHLARWGASSWDEVMDRIAREKGGRHVGRWVNSQTPTTFVCSAGHVVLGEAEQRHHGTVVPRVRARFP